MFRKITLKTIDSVELPNVIGIFGEKRLAQTSKHVDITLVAKIIIAILVTIKQTTKII